MSKITLITSDNCPLCDKAKEELDIVGAEIKLKEVNIYEIREYHEKYWDKIPVLRSGDKELLWPFSAQEIEKFLAL